MTGYDPLNNSPPCHSGQLLTPRQTKPPPTPSSRGKHSSCNTWGKCKMRWKAPKGNGGKQVIHFIIKRRMAGKKIVDQSMRGGEQLHHICYREGRGRESLLIQNTCHQLQGPHQAPGNRRNVCWRTY